MDPMQRFASTAAGDSAFGPVYDGQFDFTLLFESVFMTIVPSCLIAGFCPFYIASQYKKPIAASRTNLLWSKLSLATVITALEIVRAVMLCQIGYVREQAELGNNAIAGSTTAVVAAIAVSAMIYWEHVYASRASSLLSLYLTLSVLLEATKAYSLLHRPAMNVAGALTLGLAATKGGLVILQEIPRKLMGGDSTQGKVSNEVTGGFWNRTLVFWINSTLFIGFRRLLKMKDLARIGPDYSSEALADRFERIWATANKKSPNALLKTSARTVFWPLVLSAVPRIFFTGFFFTTPLLLQAALKQINNPDSSRDAAKGLTAATALVFTGIGLSAASYTYMINRTATLLRGVLISQILKKNIRLSMAEARQAAAFTLMTTDVDGIIAVLEKIHDFWIAFPELALGLYLLSTVIGKAFFTPMIPIILSISLAWAIGRTMSPATTKWNQAMQKRISNTNWILSQIKGLKMMGLEDTISSFIKQLRIDEITASRDARWVRVLLMSIYPIEIWFSPMVAVTAGLFWTVWRDQLDAISLFTALGFLELLSDPTHSINFFWPELGVMYACFGRIERFLLGDERQDPRIIRDFRKGDEKQTRPEKASAIDNDKYCMCVENLSVTSENSDREILHQLSFSVLQGSLALIVGPIGSGKTVLIKTLLGETDISSGKIEIASANFAYCDQSPWLPDVSIREAIIAEYDIDEVRYNEVLRACALEEDITSLSKGDRTLCGMNGSNLSGGQKQRVALARAVYSLCPVVVCDDVLSALDAATATSIFRSVFSPTGMLKAEHRTVIMATHMVDAIPAADKVISLNAEGAADIYDNANVIAEFAASAQMSALQAARDAREPPVNPNITDIQEDLEREAEEVASARRGTDLSVYKFLFQDIPKSLTVSFFLSIILMAAMERFPGIYMRIWVTLDPSNKLYLIGMGLFGVLSIVMNSATTIIFLMKIIPRIAQSMHDLFLGAVLQATLPFLTSTKNGTLINRFSQDMTLLSQDMPMSLFRLLYTTTLIVMNIGVIAAGADYASVLIPFLLVVLYVLQAFYLRTSRQMRLLDLEAKSPLYTQVSEMLTGIEHIRSFGWQSATIQKSLTLLDYSQTPFYYMYSIQRWLLLVLDMCAALMSTLLVAIAVLWTSSATQPSLGLALLAATQYSRTTRLWVVRWTALETSLGAVTRLQNFMNTTPVERRHTFGVNPDGERDPEHIMEENDLEPLRGWPTAGCIEFDNVNAMYSTAASVKVLQNVSLFIPAGHSVALVGRTGSGKSSAMLSILNFLEVTGKIYIDGIDISQVSRNRLRSVITTIPQDPLILPGTVQDNLLPFTMLGEAPITSERTAAVQKTLRDVGLWDHIEERGGLEAQLDDMYLSAGQKQVLGIARAIIHHEEGATKVILMDEVSSNMDQSTDMRLQQVMREAFAGSTRLIISHRPSGFSDIDMRVTLDNGQIADVSYTDTDSSPL